MHLILASALVKQHSLSTYSDQISQCNKCPRLRQHCQKIAQIKRKSYENDPYWGKPVSGFGDPKASLIIVGLAPAAHGANRTGRMFTGDRSGLWLYRALHKQGFANQPESHSREDSLRLLQTYITSVVKCAPPDNKPTPIEIQNCKTHLEMELDLLAQAKVYLALGKIALDGAWPHLVKKYQLNMSRPKFKHGAEVKLVKNKITLLMSYHPSQQNTFTGRLTESMFDSVFKRAKALI